MDARIRETYARKTKSANINSLYDSYIRAFRWASDRIAESGIVAFVTNGGFLRSEAACRRQGTHARGVYRRVVL